MGLSREEFLDVIKTEMTLIQTSIDKYDQLIYQNRNWCLSAWIFLLGLSIEKGVIFACFSVLAVFAFLVLESTIRINHRLKFVGRYREIREMINSDTISGAAYDLTGHLSNSSPRLQDAIKGKYFIFHGVLSLISIVYIFISKNYTQ